MRRIATQVGLALLVALVAVAVQAPILLTGAAADDHLVLGRADSVTDALRGDLLGRPLSAGGTYRPLWQVIVAAIGDDARALHAVSIGLFAVCAVFVWVLARGLLAPGRSVVAGLVFAAYPRHAEAVAMISHGGDLLGVALVLLTLVIGRAGGRRWRALVAVPCAVAALAASPLALAAGPLAVLFASRRPTVDGDSARSGRLTGVAIIAAHAAALAAVAVATGTLAPWSEEHVTPARILASITSAGATAVTPPGVDPLDLLPVAVAGLLVAAGVVVAALVIVARRPARRRAVLVGAAIAAVGLLPALPQVIDVRSSTGERSILLASVGLALVVAAVLPRNRSAGVALATAIVIASAVASAIQAERWRQAERLADRTVATIAAATVDGSAVVLLDAPTSVDGAAIFANAGSLLAALEHETGRRPALTWCAGLRASSYLAGRVATDVDSRLAATGAATFDLPAPWSDGRAALTPDCEVIPLTRPRIDLAAAIAIRYAYPPKRRPCVALWYDGRAYRTADCRTT